MKRIYMTLALVAMAATSVLAQGPKSIDLGAKPVYGPFPDNVTPGDTVRLGIELTNNGPEDVTTTDTMKILFDTYIFGEDVGDVQKFVQIGVSPMDLAAGTKDTVYLSIIAGTEFWTGEDALALFYEDSKICSWVSVYGYDGDSTYFFNDPGFDAETYVTATDIDGMLSAFTGNNRGTQDVVFGSGATVISECEPSGLTDVNYEKQNLNIYPNPTSNEVNFEFEFAANSSATVRIADITGRTVLTKDFGKQAGTTKLSVDVSSLNNGIYLVELTTEGKKAISKLTVRK